MKKIPRVKELNMEYAEVMNQKKAAYAEYRSVRLGMYDDPATVKVYKYNSNPILTDTDFDGRDDDKDSVLKNNWFDGTLETEYATSSISTFMDYRWFFNSNTVYNDQLSTVSLLFSSAVYGNKLSLRDSLSLDTTNVDSM